MNIETFLKQKKVDNPLPKLRKQLKTLQEGKQEASMGMNEEVVALGLKILGKDDYLSEFDLGDKELNDFTSFENDQLWEKPEYDALLKLLYGEAHAPYVKYVWNRIPYRMYQSGYERRSFRAPHHQEFKVLNRANFLRSILEIAHEYDYTDRKNRYYQLSIEEEVVYGNDLSLNTSQFMIWSAALDMDHKGLYTLMEDIVFSKHPVGKVTDTLVKALLNSEKKECWELVSKLLIAAQRQEGLRQTVLEALDETSIGALKFMIDVILEHKLTRFSATVRALDVWVGLGWESEKESTVKKALEFAQIYLNQPERVASGIKSANNLEAYMALWSLAVGDMSQTIPYLRELVEKGDVEKKCLALMFAEALADHQSTMPIYYEALKSDSLEVLANCFNGLIPILDEQEDKKTYIQHAQYPDLFERLKALGEKITVAKKEFEGKVFSWSYFEFDKDNIYEAMMSLVGDDEARLEYVLSKFEHLGVLLRGTLTSKILKDTYCYSYESITKKGKKYTISEFQKNFALKIITDKGEAMVASALKTLSYVKLEEKELSVLRELLKRKSSVLRKHLLSLIMVQSESLMLSFVDALVAQGDMEQRLGALELLHQMDTKKVVAQKEIATRIVAYKERPKLSEKERELLQHFETQGDKEQLSAENGYGLFDPKVISPYALPVLGKDSFYLKVTQENPFGFSKPVTELSEDLKKLVALFNKHKNYEYEVIYADGSKEKELLGNTIRPVREQGSSAESSEEDEDINEEEEDYDEEDDEDDDSEDESYAFEDYPLYEVWDQWYTEVKWKPIDLFLITFEEECYENKWRPFLEKFVCYHKKLLPNPKKGGYSWDNPISTILDALKLKYVFEEKQEFLIDATINLYSQLPEETLKYKPKRSKDEEHTSGDGWQSESEFHVFLDGLSLEDLDEEQLQKVWHIYRWRQQTGLPENIPFEKPPLYLYLKAFEQKRITEHELYDGILEQDRLRSLTAEGKDYELYGSKKTIKDYPYLEKMVDTIRETFLEVELKRGNSDTPVTRFVQCFQKIYGINRLVALLQGLGKGNLYRGYIYSWYYNTLDKQKLFSYLIKHCYPEATATQEQFDAALKTANISEVRLIEAAIYAPQWQKYISKYLNWKGLDAAIWWMHAHTKTVSDELETAEFESEVSKYSAVSFDDFSQGAVDKDWFQVAYKELGKARWEILYNAAKYISDGNGHRRARLYSDVLTGDLKITEVTAKVKDKRDQDYLRVYGLVPLSKANPEKDVLSRYEYLQKFKKESKEFGAMKQSSEALAIQVAMENLARNAGYPDPIRLTWAMETQQVQKILNKETKVIIDGVELSLEIDEEGKADLLLSKAGKTLKTVPAAVKKHKLYAELNDYKKTLKEQWSRSRKALEEAMVRGDEFLLSEIQNLSNHPVISVHLKKLVLVGGEKSGFFINGRLVSALGEIHEVGDKETFRIAHCVDLHRLQLWTEYQHYCFDHQLKQPFKQVFRELYVPTPDELQSRVYSRRYEGHQVQPKQALALLKTRGWKLDYDEGLQKIFHKQGLHVRLHAMADWFSPADIEAPTLETVEFYALREYKKVPLEDIEPRLFSEVMRDLDLVVSVAHVGGVDPEASHSSIEMRTVLLKESLRLFKLPNVDIVGTHAIIKGSMAEYSVHLGSAVVHQMPGKYLSILPVHSQHRGRIFLPFADEDPKSAELISKVLLLAKDQEIQDPTILRQIDRKS